MGTRGPVPKRSEQKLGHQTRAEKDAVSRVAMTGPVKPPSVRKHWHRIAKSWFSSLPESGQTRYFEPSDWQAAIFTAEVMTETFGAKTLSAAMVEVVWGMMTDLMTTEAARRRAKLEVHRDLGPAVGGDADPSSGDASVTDLADFRSMGYGS